MPRDLATKNSSRPRSTVPGWVWLFTGTVLGAFIMFLVRLSEMPADNGPATGETPTATVPAPEQNEQPRFDFYTLLKETRVPVPDVEPDKPADEPTESEQYVLQVASFKAASDAEQLRAELILLNLDAHVETAKVRNGETWHRVLVGPFESRSRLAKVRSILASNQFETLILKRSVDG